MTQDELRKEFEEHFPVPKNITWQVEEYYGLGSEDIPAADRYRQIWAGYQSAAIKRDAEIANLKAKLEKREATIVQLEMDATANACSLNTIRSMLDGPPCLPLTPDTPESALLEWTDCIHRALVFLGGDKISAMKSGE